MSVELGAGLLAVVSLLVTVPIALRIRAKGTVHTRLVRVAMVAGYCTLAIVFAVDALVRQPLSPTLRFARGFIAGIGVGLLLAGAAVAVYDIITALRASQRSA